MPELPEVQTIVDGLLRTPIIGKCIRQATVHWPKTIATSSPQEFAQQIKNKKIINIKRHGKFIVFELSDQLFLAVHLRMTGRFEMDSKGMPRSKHVHIVLNIDDGIRLLFHDTRKFGRFYLTKKINNIIGFLGPEPLSDDFTAKRLAAMLNGRKRQIKPLLLDQQFIAGLGNIYVDESLWRSRIHPERMAGDLSWQDIKSLHRAIRHVLRLGLRNAGTSLGVGLGNYSGLENKRGLNSNYLKVFRRTGQPCFKCGDHIERIVVAQRGTHICLRCQVAPRK